MYALFEPRSVVLQDPTLSERNGEGMLWGAGILLATLIDARPALVNQRRVIELGAGVGLVSMVAQLHGPLSMVATEQPGAAMAWLKRNHAANPDAGAMQCKSLFWGTANARSFQAGPVDLILGADIMYARDVHGLLLETLLELATVDTEILLAHDDSSVPHCDQHRHRFLALARDEFIVTTVDLADARFRSPDIHVYSLRRRAEKKQGPGGQPSAATAAECTAPAPHKAKLVGRRRAGMSVRRRPG